MRKCHKIRLTESQLHQVIKKSVKGVLEEMSANDIAMINGPIGNNYDLSDIVSQISHTNDNDGWIQELYDNISRPQLTPDTCRHFIEELKDNGVWNEYAKQELIRMVKTNLSFAQKCYEVIQNV